MTWFSLKRTLQLNLASSIEVLNQINQASAKSNLHTPLRYSTVLLSIGKTTQICHQNIPLKKVNCNGTVTYISAIPRTLKPNWQCSGHEIAEMLVSVLQDQTPEPVWSAIRENNDWLEFVVSQQGIGQWQQQLQQWTPSATAKPPPWPIEPEQLWQLQSGYELCCRWQRYYPSNRAPLIEQSPTAAFQMPGDPVQHLIHCLLDICDSWGQTKPPQLLRQARALVMALQKCIGSLGASQEIGIVIPWLESTRIMLQQVLTRTLGYPIADQF